jgi:hypothetical protein
LYEHLLKIMALAVQMKNVPSGVVALIGMHVDELWLDQALIPALYVDAALITHAAFGWRTS